MYAQFVRHVSLPLYHWWHGSTLMSDMRKFEDSQWFPQERLRAMQWERLSRLLEHAYLHVPYYRDTFKEIGAKPQDFRSIEDFAKFPVLKKRTLQERVSDLLATNIPSTELVKGITSGSSGLPTFHYRDLTCNRIRTAAGKRLNRIAGHSFGSRVFSFWRDSPFVFEGTEVRPAQAAKEHSASGLSRLKRAVHARFGVENQVMSVDPTWLSEVELTRLYDRLKKFRPEIIVSYVNALCMLAQYLEANRLEGIRPRSVIVSSEMLHPHQRELMERVFGCRVFNRYGLSETGIVAIECSAGTGLHLNQEILHLEEAPDDFGTTQLVVTDLINRGMPLLRYETGDTGRLIGERCGCGRGLWRIGDLTGRVIDLLPTRLGGHVNGQLFATFHWIAGVKQYQVVQEAVDAFTIRIVRTPSFVESDLAPMLQTIRERFGDDTAIKVEYVEYIPFTQGGKYKLVVSEARQQEVSGRGFWPSRTA
jgi:phenylacetate-CoA ligase